MGTSYQTVIDALEARHCRFDRRTDTQAVCQCPAHEDNNPSLSVTYKRDGDKAKTLLNCFAGCTVDSIVAALGLKESDLFDHDRNDETIPQHTAMPRENSTHAPQWHRCDGYTFEGMIDNTPLTCTDYDRLCEQAQAAHGARANIAMGACPNCKNRTLRLVCVAVPPSQYFTLAHCEHCSARDLFEAFTTFDASMKRRMSVSDTHVVIYENDNGVRFAYPDGVTVCRKADGKGGKRIRRQGDKGKHAPYLSDVVLDYLPARDKTIYVVEGEKDATALLAVGYAAVSLLGGAANVTACNDPAALLDTVRGCNVVCVVDDDRQGLAWADAVHGMLASHIGKDIISLRFIQGRDGIHDAGDAAATGRFDFDVLGRGVVETPVETPERPHAVKRVGVCRRAEDVQIRKIEWLHEPIIPLDYLTMISGRSGVSKSTLALHYAALASRGKLDGDYAGTPVTVGITAAEDTDGLIKARFVAAGGDVRRLRYVDVEIDTGGPQPVHGTPVFPDELELLVDKVEANDIKLWIIDPITAMMNGDSNKLTDVRKVLTPLAELAERLHIAIVLITHFNKGGGYASDKVSGSTAWRDAMRSLLIVAQEDKEGGDIVMTLDKSSTTGAAHSSWAYSLTEASVEGVNSDGEAVQVQVTAVGTVMPTTKTVNQVINENNAAGMEVGKPQNREIEAWLVDVLNDGPMRFKELAQLAKDDMGYTESQLHNAQQRAADRIVSIPDPDHVGRGRPRLWKLATTVQQAGEQ